MNRRDLLKLFGKTVALGAAVTAFPGLLLPGDDEFEDVKRYWQGWSPKQPMKWTGIDDYSFGVRNDTWGVKIVHDVDLKSGIPLNNSPEKAGVFSKDALIIVRGNLGGL